MKFAEMTQEIQVARPAQVRFDIGLTPGRRRIAKQYEKAMEQAAIGEEVDIPRIMLYDLGDNFPQLEVLT